MSTLHGIAYLACPYASDHKEVKRLRLALVTDTAGRLMQKGQVIFSPLTHNAPIAAEVSLPTNWNFWSRIDLAFLSHCSRLLVLTIKGWEESIGVQAEIKAAKAQGIPVYYIDYRTLSTRKAP